MIEINIAKYICEHQYQPAFELAQDNQVNSNKTAKFFEEVEEIRKSDVCIGDLMIAQMLAYPFITLKNFTGELKNIYDNGFTWLNIIPSY